MATPDQRPGHMLVVDRKTSLTQQYLSFAHVTREQYTNIGIPEPVGSAVYSVNLLEWLDNQLPNGATDEEISQVIKQRVSINPYDADNMAELSMGSDGFSGHSWDYPAVHIAGCFQLITTEPKSGSPIQLEIPSLRGIEKWALEKGIKDNYLHQRLLGIGIVDKLEQAMIKRYQENLLPLVCQSFASKGISIDPKKLSPTRFYFLEDYTKSTNQNPSDNSTVNKTRQIAGKQGSFAILEMQFQIS